MEQEIVQELALALNESGEKLGGEWLKYKSEKTKPTVDNLYEVIVVILFIPIDFILLPNGTVGLFGGRNRFFYFSPTLYEGIKEAVEYIMENYTLFFSRITTVNSRGCNVECERTLKQFEFNGLLEKLFDRKRVISKMIEKSFAFCPHTYSRRLMYLLWYSALSRIILHQDSSAESDSFILRCLDTIKQLLITPVHKTAPSRAIIKRDFVG